jgi:ubiquinone/menaquinone biosynthesis C-methylase UbiE
MERQEQIQSGYKKGASRYDALLSTQSIWSKIACKVVWGFPDTAYVGRLLSWIPADFDGKLLDVPVGTAIFTCGLYINLPGAQITCIDYSEAMMNQAKTRFASENTDHITCMQGDVGNLPFQDATFDIVLSMNGFHAFPDKEAAYNELYRVLKPGGELIGCFYVQGEVRRTDWFIRNFYVSGGYFTPPFETIATLRERLKKQYESLEMWNMGAIVCFRCVK